MEEVNHECNKKVSFESLAKKRLTTYNFNIDNMILFKNEFPKQLEDVIRQFGKTGENMKNYIQGNIYRTMRDCTDHSPDKCDIPNIQKQK